jgi:hypothetical protein
MEPLAGADPAFDPARMFPVAVSGAASATAQAKDNTFFMIRMCLASCGCT